MKGFRLFIIISLIVTAILFIIYGGMWMSYRSKITTPERKNLSCDTEERVFDYANKLSNAEEESLEKLICKYEEKLGFDIVLVLLNEDIGYETADYSYNNYDVIENWAKDFYSEHNFGWDNEDNDGVIFVANYLDGYAWLQAYGNPYYKCSGSRRDAMVDEITANLRENPYKACKTYVNEVFKNMTGLGIVGVTLPGWVKYIVGLIAATVFLLCNVKSKAGKVTVNKDTYIEPGNAKVIRNENTFLSKHTTSRRIETSSSGSSGGGGGSSGSSGGSGGRF